MFCDPRMFVPGAEHRALDDAMVTAHVLRALLRRYERSRYPQSVGGLIGTIALPPRHTRWRRVA